MTDEENETPPWRQKAPDDGYASTCDVDGCQFVVRGAEAFVVRKAMVHGLRTDHPTPEYHKTER